MTADNRVLSSVLVSKKLLNGTFALNDYKVNDYLYRLAYDPKSSISVVTKLFNLYFYMENKTFNTRKFYNIPKRYFPQSVTVDSNGTKTISIKAVDTSVSRFYSYTLCINVLCSICYGNDPNCPDGGFTVSCTTINGYDGGSTFPAIPATNPIPVWTPGNPSSGGGGSGGGGSTGGNSTSPCIAGSWYSRPSEPPCPSTGLPPHIFSIAEKIDWIRGVLVLNQLQSNWLNNNSEYAVLLYDELSKEVTPETKATAKIIIDQGLNNLINAPWGESFGTAAAPHLQALNPCCLLFIPTVKFSIETRINYAINRYDHPEWSKLKCFWEAEVESIHLALDGAGLVPVFGEVFDLANSLIYTIQGDGLNATMSLLSAVPVAGTWVTLTKWAKKTITALDGTRRTLKWIKQTNNIISFGDRGLLRKVLGLGSALTDSRIAHHLIPWEHGIDDLVQKAASGKIAFNLNELVNGLPISALQHTPPHNVYNSKIKSELVRLYNANGGAAMTTDRAETLVRELALKIRNWIVANPTRSINDIVL